MARIGKYNFEWRNVIFALVVALAIGTILTVLFGDFGVETLSLGKAWIILFITIFISYYFFASEDRRIDRNEITVMIFIAAIFFIMGFIMHRFIPEIFTSLPEPLQVLFSAVGA